MIENFREVTKEEVLLELEEIHDNKYDYSFMDSFELKSNLKLKVFCKNCNHFFTPTLGNHLKRKSGCPYCAKEKRNETYKSKKTIIDFNALKLEFNNIHNFKYTYIDDSFSRMTIPMKIICPEHGEFLQKPSNHKNGKGCPECGKISMKNKLRYSNEEISKILEDKHNYSFDINTYIGTKKQMKFFCEKHGEFWQRPMNQLRQDAGCPICSTTKAEKELITLYPFLLHRNREIIKPLEIDLLSIDYKFGIEFNGNLWHSFGKTFPNNLENLEKDKHSTKTNLMENNKYQLFHILDIDWENPIKKEIWKSIINSKIGKTERIFARKTTIEDLSNQRDTVKSFLNNNHLQGYGNYKYAYGLLNKFGKLIALMTFGRPTEDSSEWEIKRFCNFQNTTIVGGASKLLKHFERLHKPKSIVSYAKRDWSMGNLYEKLGFTFVGTTEPSKFYIKNNIKYSRQKFQKYKLPERLKDGLISHLNGNTAQEILFNNGYRVFFDAGNLKYRKTFKGFE